MADAEKILNELLNTIVKNEAIENPQIEIKPLSTAGANYTTTLYLITVKDNETRKLELFAKIACIGEKMRQDMEGNLYATERFVYQDLAKVYENLQDQAKIREEERFKFPKFYACSDKYSEETMIFENLMAKGYTCHDRLKPVTWEYAEAAVGALAKFHALSYAFAEHDPKGFEQVAAERKMIMDGTDENSIEISQKAAMNIFQFISQDMAKRLGEFFMSRFDANSFPNYIKSVKRRALVHGDYRPSNLMHKNNEDGKVKLIPIDYQTMYAGAPLVDLFHFILSATDGQFRKLHLKRLLNHYYETCATFLKKLGLDPEVIYPKEVFDEEYEKFLPFGLPFAMNILPIIFVESEKAPTISKATDIVVEPNELFKKRYIELIEDYIQWGIV